MSPDKEIRDCKSLQQLAIAGNGLQVGPQIAIEGIILVQFC